MGPYKTPWLTDDVIESSAFQSIFDMPNNNFLGLNSDYIAEAKDNRPGPVVQGEDGEMYAQDSTYTREGWETEQTGDTPLYYYARSQELGDVYEGNYFNRQDNGNISVQGNYVSEETIKGDWDADQGMGYFKEANPDLDFDTYLSFIKDSSSLVNQGLNRDEDPEPFNALADQYGINTSFQNDDGDMFEFNGSNFTKTFKTPEADYGRMLVAAGAGAMLAPLATQFAAGALGSAGTSIGIAANTNPLLASAATAAGTAAPSALATGIGAGVASAGSQALLTGSIDPKSVLVNAAMAGIGNPGQYVAKNLVPQVSPTTGSWMLSGTSPGNFVNGVIEGSVNAGLTDALVNGSVDLKQAGLTGLLQGGKNVIQDTLADYDLYSPEAAKARYLESNPYATPADAQAHVDKLIATGDLDTTLGTPTKLNTTNLGAVIGKGGLLPFIPELNVAPIRDGLGMLSNAVDGLMNGVKIDDYITLKDGTRIQTDTLTDEQIADYMYTSEYNGASRSEVSTMGLANNPVVNTIGKGVNFIEKNVDKATAQISNFFKNLGESEDPKAVSNGVISPTKVKETLESMDNPKVNAISELMYENIDSQIELDNPKMDTRAKVIKHINDKNGGDIVSDLRARAKAILAYREKEGDPFWHGKYGLDEKYNFNSNPRGDTEVKGVANAIDKVFMTGENLYSTGADLSGTRPVPKPATPPGINPLILNLDKIASGEIDSDAVVLPDAGSAEAESLDYMLDALMDLYLATNDNKTVTNAVTTNSPASTANNTAAISAGGSDNIASTNTILAGGTDNTATTTTQLPTSGGATITLPESTPDPRNPRSSDPVLWTDLEWRQNNLGYKGKGDRARAYDKNMGMLKQAMAAQALGVDFRLPKGLTDKELYEAGKLT